MDLSTHHRLAYNIFLHVVNGLIELYVSSYPNTRRVPWSVKPPALLMVNRANAWKNYKCQRSRYGRRSDIAIESLAHFNSVNYQLRHFINKTRAQYEQKLIENYFTASKNFFMRIFAKRKRDACRWDLFGFLMGS